MIIMFKQKCKCLNLYAKLYKINRGIRTITRILTVLNIRFKGSISQNHMEISLLL